MARKVDKKDVATEVDDDNATVLVNVIRNFRDATDNNRPITSGPNSYYRTNKDRADKLVEAGFCKYEEEAVEVAKVTAVDDLTNPSDDSNSKEEDATTNPSDDNSPNE